MLPNDSAFLAINANLLKRAFARDIWESSINEIQLILCFYDLLDHNDHTLSNILFNYSLNCVFGEKC